MEFQKWRKNISKTSGPESPKFGGIREPTGSKFQRESTVEVHRCSCTSPRPLKCMRRCKVCREQRLKTRWDMKLKFSDFEAYTVSPMQRNGGECRRSISLGWNPRMESLQYQSTLDQETITLAYSYSCRLWVSLQGIRARAGVRQGRYQGRVQN